METKTFEEKLTKAIEECGKWITENAADIAGKTEGRSNLEITVNMGLDNSTPMPSITIMRSHASMEAFEALYNV